MASHDGSVRVYDVTNATTTEMSGPPPPPGQEPPRRRRLELIHALTDGHDSSDVVTCVAYSDDGERIVSGSKDGTVRLWDANTGERLGVHRKHTGIIYSVCFAPTTTTTTSSSSSLDGGVGGFHRHRRRRRYGSGYVIASGSRDKYVGLWRVADDDASNHSGNHDVTLMPGHHHRVYSVAFHPVDPLTLVSGSQVEN